MRGIFGAAQQNKARQGFTGAPGEIAHDPPPPPPALPHNPVLAIQAPPAGNASQSDAYISSKGAVNMIQMGHPSNQEQKLITRQVNMAIQAPLPTPEYLDWSHQYIGFGREDHPYKVPRPGHSPLVVDARIDGYDCSKIFLDAGSSINLIYAKTLRAMNISLTNLTPSLIGFHCIVPGKAEILVGKIMLDVIFGTPDNFIREKLEFEVVDWPTQYHAILGRPAYSRFMAITHHTYLLMKLPGPKGVITIRGSFTKSGACDRDFHKLSESFGMQAEFLQIASLVDPNVSPDVRHVAPDQAFDTTKDTKTV
jgi:hypothetical protein